MNFQEIREKSWSGGNGSALRAVMTAPLGNQLVLFPLNLSASLDQSLGHIFVYLINRDKHTL